MKQIRLQLMLLFFGFLVGCASTIPGRPDALGLGSVKFSYEQPERWELANGLVVYYRYNDELPQISGTLYLPGGDLYESVASTGVAGATGAQMRAGGTKQLPPHLLDARLDALGAAVSTSYGEEFGSASFYSLTVDFDEVFGLFADVIREPRFDTDRLALWKQLAKESIRRRKDDPNTMAAHTFAVALYGPESPYAKAAITKDVDAIRQSALRDFHAQFVRPNGAILAASGNIPMEQFKAAVAEQFADWPRNENKIGELPTPTRVGKPGVYLLERNFNQATAIIGHFGPARLTPDMFTMSLFNTIFGHSSFSSVLFEEIRTRQGLAYSTWGGFLPGTLGGEFQIYLGTRVEQVHAAIKAAIEVSEQARRQQFDTVKVNEARQSVEQSFVFKFNEPADIVTRAALLDLLDYPEGFDQRYLDAMRAVTPAMVQEFAERELNPKDFIVVVVGNVDREKLKAELGSQYQFFTVTFDEVARIRSAP